MLLLEAAHPLVAAGISSHSHYRSDPWRRLSRTITAYLALIFSTRAEADRAAALIRARHAAVRGRIDRPMGSYPAGTSYAADDPELLMWVHAACIDTALVTYGTYVRRLSTATQEAFYDEMKVVASMLGIPLDAVPPRLADFHVYMERRLATDVCVTDAAREIAAVVLDPPVPLALRPLAASLRSLTIAMLPDTVRRAYGLDAGLTGSIFAASAPLVRHVLVPLAHAKRVPRREESAVPGGLALEIVTLLARTSPSTSPSR